jgi:site-specific DNA-methyltransferase (adenine-specific)
MIAKQPYAQVKTEDVEIKLYLGDSIELMKEIDEGSIDMIFADPPYFLSNGGITCKSGRMVPVDKGKWDRSSGLSESHDFNKRWLAACKRVLSDKGTIWISGTIHNIYSIGFALQELDYKILNDIIWHKSNPPPNLACKCFTHATETVLWAAKSPKAKYRFNYQLMKKENMNRQMKNVWNMNAAPQKEKKFGKHPTQKPIELLTRIIRATTNDGDLILDPFIGSGTTAVAALQQNRNCIGIDTEEEFLTLARKRLINLTNQKKIDRFDEKEKIIVSKL